MYRSFIAIEKKVTRNTMIFAILLILKKANNGMNYCHFNALEFSGISETNDEIC